MKYRSSGRNIGKCSHLLKKNLIKSKTWNLNYQNNPSIMILTDLFIKFHIQINCLAFDIGIEFSQYCNNIHFCTSPNTELVLSLFRSRFVHCKLHLPFSWTLFILWDLRFAFLSTKFIVLVDSANATLILFSIQSSIQWFWMILFLAGVGCWVPNFLLLIQRFFNWLHSYAFIYYFVLLWGKFINFVHFRSASLFMYLKLLIFFSWLKVIFLVMHYFIFALLISIVLVRISQRFLDATLVTH